MTSDFTGVSGKTQYRISSDIVIIQLDLAILSALVVIGLLLGIYREDWLTKYMVLLAIIVALPFVILLKVVSIVLILPRLFWALSGMFLKAVGKSIVYVVSTIVLALIIGLTYFVPHIGSTIQKLDEWLGQFIDTSDLVAECRYARQMMVEIVTEQDNRSLEYELEEQYREELARVKESGKKRLSAGESVLSLFIGGGLLISQVYGFELFQSHLYGLAATVAIQTGLFIIAVSILYRVSILDFLAYTGSEEFSSIEEMDVALSYQKAVSHVGFIQHLTFMVVLAMRLTNADRETIRIVLGFHYDDDTTYFESMKFAWKRLRVEKSN